MACTTILVGAKATNDGSTIIARNDDTGNGAFDPVEIKKVSPEEQPRTYTGVASHLTIELPGNPLAYTSMPNADQRDGVWGEAGINAANVSMTATETISSNARVLGADPLVVYAPAQGKEGEPGYIPEKPGGIGEENLITIILPYIKTAKEGVLRLGELLEKYGTYEMNGVAFGDEKEVWYIETIGGHHWIARRVPDDCYVAQPNRQGIDRIDLRDALGEGRDYLCSKDLAVWMRDNHLNMVFDGGEEASGDMIDGIPAVFNPRYAFTSWTWLDTVYNNPRAWYIMKRFNPTDEDFNGANPKYNPESMNIPWCLKPEAKLSVLDVKNMLSTTYDGTKYDCYGKKGTPATRDMYREIGINRTSQCCLLQIRPYAAEKAKGVHWLSYASNPFNTTLALFASVKSFPEYLATDADNVSTDSLYWQTRIIAAMADCEYFDNLEPLSNYKQVTMAKGYEHLKQADERLANGEDADKVLTELNDELVSFVKRQTGELLKTVLYTRSYYMHNAFGASDH